MDWSLIKDKILLVVNRHINRFFDDLVTNLMLLTLIIAGSFWIIYSIINLW